MKRLTLLVIAVLMLTLVFAACGVQEAETKPPAPDAPSPGVQPPDDPPSEVPPPDEAEDKTGDEPPPGLPELLTNTIFSYSGKDYDMRDHQEAINAILDCVPVGKHIVVICHVSPKNNVYGIFNTETETFEPDIWGCNLIWRDEDITTSVYSYWSGIYAYSGEKLAELELSEDEWIDELMFTDDASSVEVFIRSFFEDEPRTVTVDIVTGQPKDGS